MNFRARIPQPKPKISLPQRIILVHTSPDLSFLKKKLGLSRKGGFFLAELWAEGAFFLCGPVLGAPQAAIVLEYLAASGVKEILALGWAGALKEKFSLGGLFLPEKALSAEGTSAHYGYYPYPDRDLFWWLYHELVAQGLFFEVGTVVSTDAPYRETEAFFRRFPEAVAVDMETSALFSVARALGLSLASVLIFSDRLFPRYERLKPQKMQETLETLIPVLRVFGQRS